MTLLAIFGCDPSAREMPASLEGISIDAAIEQTIERHGAQGEGYTTNHVRVVLQDREGHLIERDDLAVTMNGVALETRLAHDNYYDRHPFYRLNDTAAYVGTDELCHFAVQRPDRTHHEAGFVRTPKSLLAVQFDLPVTGSRAQLGIGWNGLAEPAELVIFRSYSYVDHAGNTVLENGSPHDLDALRRTIGPGMFRRASGRLEIPAHYLADHDGRRVSEIGVEVTVTHDGAVHDPFSKASSSLRAVRRLILRTELVD